MSIVTDNHLFPGYPNKKALHADIIGWLRHKSDSSEEIVQNIIRMVLARMNTVSQLPCYSQADEPFVDRVFNTAAHQIATVSVIHTLVVNFS